MKRVFTVVGFLVFLFAVTATHPSMAESNVLFILDGSGSMWGQVDGVAKIDTAKKVLKDLLADIPRYTNVGIMAYGHRKKEDCKDVELLSPIGVNNPDKLSAGIDSIQPKGKTPLAYSLEQALPLFASLKEQNNSIILVSDGEETCGGDPCKIAKTLSASGINLKVHVVGFNVSDEQRSQLECIAEGGNGRYFNASNTEGLKKAFAQVKQEVVKTPPPKKPKIYFFDDFEGDELGEVWKISHPNPDTFIVEEGGLLIVSSAAGDLTKDNIENLFRLDKPIPKGDWMITAKMKIDFQTAHERAFISLFKDKTRFMIVQIFPVWQYEGHNGNDLGLIVEFVKNNKGKTVRFTKRIKHIRGKGRSFSQTTKDIHQPILLRLKKKKHSYFASIMLKGDKKPRWIELEKITSLRAPKGNLVMGFYQAGKVSGESSIVFDWLKIESLD